MTELLRTGVRRLIAEAVEAELQDFLEQFSEYRTQQGIDRLSAMAICQNGSSRPELDLSQSRFRKSVIKVVRGIKFNSILLPPYLRKTKTVEDLLPWLYLKGISSGDFQEALRCLLGPSASGLSASTISRCKRIWEEEHTAWNRCSLTRVNYLVADLFAYPSEWAERFNLVYECNTIQVLPGKYRIQARDSMVSLLAPQGYLVVSCRSRLKGEQEDDIPLPLDKEEIDGFICGLSEESFDDYKDTQDPPVPHFFASYQK